MEFTIELARPADDPALRRIVAANPVPGSVALTYEREPDYFAGCATMGPFWQVLVARARPTGALAGFATRAVRQRYVDGVAQAVGYLGQLRVDRPYRGHGLTARAYDLLRELHGDGRAGAYLASIVEGNAAAHRLLVERPPRGAPRFRPLARIVTLALVARPMAPRLPQDLELSWGAHERLAAATAFLREHGGRRQLAPVYGEAELRGGAQTPGFDPADLCVATRGGAIVGLIGLWDQRAYKQTVVRGYSATLGALRPLYNLAAGALRARGLPAPGRQLHSLYGCFLAVADDSPELLGAMLRAALSRAAMKGAGFLLIGLAEGDPLLSAARAFLHLPYYSRLYLAAWDEKGPFDGALARGIASPEIASL